MSFNSDNVVANSYAKVPPPFGDGDQRDGRWDGDEEGCHVTTRALRWEKGIYSPFLPIVL